MAFKNLEEEGQCASHHWHCPERVVDCACGSVGSKNVI